jgi:MFS family permease
MNMPNHINNKALTKEQKESVFLLSIGTFLEYFDLMLYVHMSVLLNKLFFPQDNKLVAEMFAIFAFCSTFVLRPIGGLIVGWIGDHVGRKNTIIITTLTMGICCLMMANVKTYEEMGITASVIVIICRVLQGFSSMGEIVGAQLYLAETLRQPYKYTYSKIIEICANLGGVLALIIAYISISIASSWRVAFWIGAIIAFVGLIARSKLRETPEFADYKRRLKIKQSIIHDISNKSATLVEKIDKKALVSYFAPTLIIPLSFYIAFIYTASLMEKSLNMTSEEIIKQNLKVTCLLVLVLMIVIFFIKKYHPLILAKINIIFSVILLSIIPYWFNNIDNLTSLTLLQLDVLSFIFTADSIGIVCFKYISLAKRFTILAIIFGTSAALIFGIVPFSLIFLDTYLGHYSIWIVYAPVIALYWYAIKYLKNLEIQKSLYYHYPNVDNAEDFTKYPPEKYILGEEYKAYDLNCEYSKTLINIILNKVQETNKQVNIKLIEKAIIFAKKWHGKQLRKTGEPYYSHPLAVAGMVVQYKFSTNIVVAAILHDIIEDTACTVELISKEFNSRIAEIVQRLTRIAYNEENNKAKLSIEEIMADLIRADNTEAMLIKAIDRLHNLETVHGMHKNKQKEIVIETLKSVIQHIAYTVDKLDINNKLNLEEEMYQYCKDIIRSKKIV